MKILQLLTTIPSDRVFGENIWNNIQVTPLTERGRERPREDECNLFVLQQYIVHLATMSDAASQDQDLSGTVVLPDVWHGTQTNDTPNSVVMS